MTDAIDVLMEQWHRERPDVDPWPMGILGRIVRLTSILEREYRQFFARYDLEQWEFDVLTTLRRAGEPYELTAGALLKAALVTSGAITNRIDRLEARGLVERVRDAGDRRSVHVKLTEKGREMVDELFAPHMENAAQLLQGLDIAEREQLASALRTLLEAYGDTSLS